ncbi:MAG: ATP-dependent RNA helicase RhlE, partial [Candidatus Nomurabacteria bacterium GW2011_GWA2_40_9]
MRSASAGSRPHSRFAGGNFKGGQRNSFNKRPSASKKSRFGGERIDYSRFVKKAVHTEEKPYISKNTFADFPFNEKLQKNIAKKGYANPRPIQDQSIHSILDGRDVFGLANTGTGKTAAFLLPLIDKVMKDKSEKV